MLKPSPKSKPPPPAAPEKDRLTVSIWPFKIDATGAGVQRAYVLCFLVCFVWLACFAIYALKPFPIPLPVEAVSKLLLRGG